MKSLLLKHLAAACLFIPLCASGGDGGFVKVSQENPRYFELSDGSCYVPIGYNLCFPGAEARVSEDKCFEMVEAHMKNMAANGGNYARLWVSNAFYEIEDEKPGVYNPVKIARIDRYVSLARKYGIRIKICLEHFRNLNFVAKGKGFVFQPLQSSFRQIRRRSNSFCVGALERAKYGQG